MNQVIVKEVSGKQIGVVNKMCTVHYMQSESVLKEVERIHLDVEKLGVRTFAGFGKERCAARLEIMPINAAPFAISGDNLWFIRCI